MYNNEGKGNDGEDKLFHNLVESKLEMNKL